MMNAIRSHVHVKPLPQDAATQYVVAEKGKKCNVVCAPHPPQAIVEPTQVSVQRRGPLSLCSPKSRAVEPLSTVLYDEPTSKGCGFLQLPKVTQAS